MAAAMAATDRAHSNLHAKVLAAEEARHQQDNLPYRVKSVSRESAVGKADSVRTFNRKTHWSSARREDDWIVLELEEKCLVSAVEIFNKSASECSVAISRENRKRNFITVKSGVLLPHDRKYEVKVGHLPAQYVRITFARGTPIAVHSIRLFGLPLHLVEPRLGASLESLLCDRTEDLLFGSSLEASLPPTEEDYDGRVPPKPKLMAFDDTVAFLETIAAATSARRLPLGDAELP